MNNTPLYTRILKNFTLPFRSAVAKGYKVTDIMYGCRQGYRSGRWGAQAFDAEARQMVHFLETQRSLGRDLVAVVHGLNHPKPDMLCTRIYERK